MKNKRQMTRGSCAYEIVQGERVYRKVKIGTVRELPHPRDAEKAALRLRPNINNEVRSPETVVIS